MAITIQVTSPAPGIGSAYGWADTPFELRLLRRHTVAHTAQIAGQGDIADAETAADEAVRDLRKRRQTVICTHQGFTGWTGPMGRGN